MVRLLIPKCIAKLKSIEEKIGYRLSGRLNIYIYPSHDHLDHLYVKQQFHADYNDGGVTEVQGNNIHVYCTGIQSELLRQITDAIAENLLVEMLYGGTVQERIKYATLMHLPTWFGKGLTQYLSRGWNGEADNLLRDAFNSTSIKSFNKLTEEDQILVGQSMWNYLEHEEGNDAIQRILYLVRLTRKVETALYFINHKTTKELYESWHELQSGLYAHELNRRVPSHAESLNFALGEQFFHSMDLGPGGKRIVSAYYENGKRNVVILDRETSHDVKIYSEFHYYEGYQPSKSDMLVKWKDDEHILLIINGRKLEILELNLKGDVLERYELDVDVVSWFDYHPATAELILSASKYGISDLYLFNLKNFNFTALTADLEDDLFPSFDPVGNIYFSRSVNEGARNLSGMDQLDVFFLFRKFDQSIELTNVTKTNEFDEFMPLKTSTNYLTFLSDRNGIVNAYAYTLSGEIYALSDYQSDIIWQGPDDGNGKLAEILLRNGRLQIYISEVETNNNLGIVLHPSATQSQKRKQEDQEKKSVQNLTAGDTNDGRPSQKVYFQTKFPIPLNVDSLEQLGSIQEHQRVYRSDSMPDNVMNIQPIALYSKLDNSNFLTDVFPAFGDFERQLTNHFGVVLGMKLEDQYKFNSFDLSMRSSISFDQFQFKLNYENRQGKWVKSVSLNAEGYVIEQNSLFFRQKFNLVQGSVKRPLTSKLTVGYEFGYRVDGMIELASGKEAFNNQPLQLNMLSSGFRTQFNNSHHAGHWTFEGLQANYFCNWLKAVNAAGSSVNNQFDAGYGYKIGRDLMWMNRIHGGNSLGTHKTSFFMGGGRNQVSPEYHANVVLMDNLSYIQPVYGLRNTSIGVRNGTSYAFLNSELFVPVYKWIGKKPLKSNLLQNLWLVAFADAGTAWYGRSPYDRLNPANKSTISYGAINVVVYNTRNPIVYSLGSGLRTNVMGYFLRYDVSYTLDNNVIGKHLHCLALSRPF